jgi:large subunit ribosomal protein L21
VFKFKQKATYRRKKGHRQHLTRVRIDEITASGAGRRRAAKPAPRKRSTAKAKAENAPAETTEKKPAARERSTAKAEAAKAEE